MKDRPVAVIEADKLLEWLESLKKDAESRIRTAPADRAKSFLSGSLFSILEVIRLVKYEKYLADKPADTEEE